MAEALILSFKRGAKERRLRCELEDWRARLRLALARDWDWRAREICLKEIQRLRAELRYGPLD